MPFSYYREHFRDVARYAPIAAIGGGFVGFAIAGFAWNTRAVLHGAFIGLVCFLCAMSADVLLYRWLQKSEAWWRRAIVYFVAGQIGWPIGLFLGMPLIWGEPMTTIHMPRRVWIIVIVTSLAGALTGATIYAYELLKERLRRSLEQVKEKEIAEKELELARELQARMLPAPEISADGYRISARNLPARYVAGDFYDVFNYADGAIGIVVADVAGKGIAASLIMASVKAVLPLLASSRSVEETLAALNEKLHAELSKREFVALTLARYQPTSGELAVANAGLPDPYIVRRSGALEIINVVGPRLPLGVKKSINYEKTAAKLETGDAVVFLSDGLPEATTADGEPVGYERLAAIISRTGASVDAILSSVNDMTNGTLDDDQTIVALRRT